MHAGQAFGVRPDAALLALNCCIVASRCYGQVNERSIAEPLAVAGGCYGQLAEKQNAFDSLVQMRDL